MISAFQNCSKFVNRTHFGKCFIVLGRPNKYSIQPLWAEEKHCFGTIKMTLGGSRIKFSATRALKRHKITQIGMNVEVDIFTISQG